MRGISCGVASPIDIFEHNASRGEAGKNPPYIRILSVGSSLALFALMTPQPGHTMPSRLSCRIKHAKQNPCRQHGITLGVWVDESYLCSQRAQDVIVSLGRPTIIFQFL